MKVIGEKETQGGVFLETQMSGARETSYGATAETLE